VHSQDQDGLNRFAVIKYDFEGEKFVYSAMHHQTTVSSCICQLQQQQGMFNSAEFWDKGCMLDRLDCR